jgi:hypothetical protein
VMQGGELARLKLVLNLRNWLILSSSISGGLKFVDAPSDRQKHPADGSHVFVHKIFSSDVVVPASLVQSEDEKYGTENTGPRCGR